MAFIDHDLTALTNRMRTLDGARIKTGIQKGSPNLQKAIWTNFGTQHIPERPVISEFNNNNLAELKGISKKAALQMIKRKKPVNAALGDIADKTEDMMRQDLIDCDTPPNAEATIANKGFDDPWWETGSTIMDVQAKIEGV